MIRDWIKSWFLHDKARKDLEDMGVIKRNGHVKGRDTAHFLPGHRRTRTPWR